MPTILDLPTPSKFNTQPARVVCCFPVGGTIPPGPCSGPVCVPFHVISNTTVFAPKIDGPHTQSLARAMRNNGSVEEAISRDPEIMHGTPVFRGTRVPVQTLFEYLEGGETLEDFLEGFPTVSRELAIQALEEAKHLLLARV